MNIDAPVFIGGSGSSGTTLLRVLLDRHPDIFCGHELSVFNKNKFLTSFEKIQKKPGFYLKNGLSTNGYFKYYGFFEHLEEYKLTQKLLLKWFSESEDVNEFCSKLFIHCLKFSRKKIFSEKTPSNTYTFRDLSRLFPKAKFIHIYRDGRDVICSLKKRGFNWFQGSSMWLYNTVYGVEASDLENFYQLNYENLVQNPEAELKKLCYFLEVKFDTEMLNPKSNADERNKGSKISSWRASPEDEINTVSVGKYKNELSDEGYAIFLNTALTEYAGNQLSLGIKTVPQLMNKLGYKVEHKSIKYPLKAKRHELEDRFINTLKSIKHFELPGKVLTEIKR